MLIDHQSPLDLNVTVRVLNRDKKLVKQVQFKNTATKRMTTGIALFLAGDEATYENRTALDAPASGLGRWRPNFISFATTGIDQQPTTPDGLAVVNDPTAFEDKNPLPGDRTRPWYLSEYLGEHSDGFWNPQYGWGTAANPNVPCFQGELVTAVDNSLKRHPLLRAEVTTDNSWERTVGQEGYSTDCILYGYTSVLWGKQLFEPEHGPKVGRIAISELGLYEMDSDTDVGRRSLMAGFRVPTVDDIIYVEPGYVMLVEWRITVRSLMPYEGVQAVGDAVPTGISIDAELIDEHHVQLTAAVHGPTGVPQTVTWALAGTTSAQTTITDTGYLTIAPDENATTFTVTAASAAYPEIFGKTSVINTSSSNFTVEHANLLTTEQSVKYTTQEQIEVALATDLTAYYGGPPAQGVLNGFPVLYNKPLANVVPGDVTPVLDLRVPNKGGYYAYFTFSSWTPTKIRVSLTFEKYNASGTPGLTFGRSIDYTIDSSTQINSIQAGFYVDASTITMGTAQDIANGIYGYYSGNGSGRSYTIQGSQAVIQFDLFINGERMSYDSTINGCDFENIPIYSEAEFNFNMGLMQRYEPTEVT